MYAIRSYYDEESEGAKHQGRAAPHVEIEHLVDSTVRTAGCMLIAEQQ